MIQKAVKAGRMTEMLDFIKERIANKKVLILGFGREGRATLRIFLEAGSAASLAIGDQKELNPFSDCFSDFEKEEVEALGFCCGADYQEHLDEYDLVMKSPGIVLKRDISEYRAEILSEMQLFFECCRDRIIGITGTKGKSTTTTLLYHILKENGAPVILAGNIGIPVFDILHEINGESLFVIELSCHQLEYATASPKWGVLLNIYEEHLDHYGTMEKYAAAKRNIYVNQKAGDVLFVNPAVCPDEHEYKGRLMLVDIKHNGGAERSEAGSKQNSGSKVYDNKLKEPDITLNISDDDSLPVITCKDRHVELPVSDISLQGEHNYLDIAYVYGICCEFHVSDEAFLKGLKSYAPLPHRLQYIGTVEGVAYYDDSISTIDETTIQALNTIRNADTVLIGGMERDISYVSLEEYLSASGVPHIILMEATGKRIYKEICENYPDFPHKERLYVVEHLEDAVSLAKKITKKGGSCILSPAAASYGIFKSFEERGEVFSRLVLG